MKLHRSTITLALLLSLVCCLSHAQEAIDSAPGRQLTAVPLEAVDLEGGFWGSRLKTHHQVTVPHALDHLEKAGHVTNFDKAAGKYDGPLRGHHAFDSDLYKALEGAIYTLTHVDDQKLRERVESMVDRILAAQQENGFLISYWLAKDYDKRWDNLRLDHQLYNAGHFFEMAVAHQQLTGEEKALAGAKRFADLIDSIFGPGQRYDVGGHEEIELALIKLAEATGQPSYMDLCKFFLDERGQAHGDSRAPFDYTKIDRQLPSFDHLPEGERNQASRRARNSLRVGRMQDHKPLVEQDQAVGHAVRAGYIYAAMADMARLMPPDYRGGYDQGYPAIQYEQALDHLWHDVVSRKMYITGGIGTAQYHDEGFGDPYLLPNERGYCESCASIAHVLWQHRMNLLKGEAKYIDVMELALYNGVLGGIAVSGDAFFYQNPLASRRGSKRSEWIGLACCPTNLTRIIPQVGGLAYAQDEQHLYANLYASGKAKISLADGTRVELTQETDYPWDGRIQIEVSPSAAAEFTICLRIPGWAQGKPVPSDLYRYASNASHPVTLTVNGESLDAKPSADGYIHVQRKWTGGEVIELNLPMPVQRVRSNDAIVENRGKVALMRGPLVYCVEAADNENVDPFALTIPRDVALEAEYYPNLLGGLVAITGTGIAATEAGEASPVGFLSIPYYAWANREQGAMNVWLKEANNAAE